jgi:hypothetical protein
VRRPSHYKDCRATEDEEKSNVHFLSLMSYIFKHAYSSTSVPVLCMLYFLACYDIKVPNTKFGLLRPDCLTLHWFVEQIRRSVIRNIPFYDTVNYNLYWMSFEVLIVTSMNMVVSWDVVTCNLADIDRRFRRVYYFHNQSSEI